MKEKLRRKHASLKIPPTIDEETTTKQQSSKILKKKSNANAEDEVYIRIGSEHLCKPNCDGCKNTFYKDKTKPKTKIYNKKECLN